MTAAVLSRVEAQEADVLAALNQAVASAEENLRIGELQIAESRYRTALLRGWLILGALHVGDDRLADARDAFERASASAVENAAALQSLSLIQVQLGDTAPALDTLTRMVSAAPRNVQTRQILAQVLVAANKPAEAVQELEAAHAIAPKDPELTFALASGYLRLKKADDAERLFGEVATARPLPQTYVLIGRTYRDFGYYDRARSALRRALKMDPRTERAHYYLGTTAVMEEGVVRLDEAIVEFRQELTLTPGDPPATLRLGMALVEARRYEEALPQLESAVRVPSPSAVAWLYLGRCQLALGRAGDAIPALRRSLEAAGSNADKSSATARGRLRSIHYQLATALRQIGERVEAEREFAEAQRLSVERTDADRESLAQYLADSADAGSSVAPALPLEVSGLENVTAAQRASLEERVKAMLARAYLNLGIVHAQAGRFARAAELFEQTALIQPAFPQVQYSLGVAYFNAQRYDKAAVPLARALEQDPKNPGVRRMLALASLNVEDYPRAAELLSNDPQLPTNASLQYAYGIALVRSNRAEEAERIFSRVLAEHPDVPELNVVVGQAHAAQGDYDAAIASLRRAIELKKDVADAHAALGVIYLQQGKLADASAALQSELASHPANLKARYTLATVMDLDGRGDAALKELRTILAERPTDADARYLFGKILLARGSAAEAAEHLEVAARSAPGDANIHYQLGQAYQRLGRSELAAREFEIFKKLKDKQRGGGA